MKRIAENLSRFPSRAIYSDTYPLDDFYAARGKELPFIVPHKPDFVPAPYNSLLVHQTDMTSTLEKFHGEPLHVELLARHMQDNEYYREVVLVLDHSKKRVEFGAIKINLNLFPAEAQAEILQEQQPLGRVLNHFNIPFNSRPTAFFSVNSDEFISTALQVDYESVLYGRRNTLLDSWERPLAEIIEILPR